MPLRALGHESGASKPWMEIRRDLRGLGHLVIHPSRCGRIRHAAMAKASLRGWLVNKALAGLWTHLNATCSKMMAFSDP